MRSCNKADYSDNWGNGCVMAESMGAVAGTRPALVLVHPAPGAGAVVPLVSADTGEPAALPVAPPAGTLYLPGEDVLLLAVPLPPMSAAQRSTAVAYAVEDRIAQPLGQVHVGLGPELPGQGGIWLVAVVAHQALAAHAAVKSVKQPRLLPDMLALPTPPPLVWAIAAGADRALVRLPDGTGFATPSAMLAAFWQAGGAPGVLWYGNAPPAALLRAGMPQGAPAPLPPGPEAALGGLDLADGLRAGNWPGLPRGWRVLAMIALLTFAGHAGMIALKGRGLAEASAQQAAAMRAALLAAGQTGTGDLDTLVARTLAARQPEPAGGFLPLTAQAFGALAGGSGGITLQELHYDRSGNALRITVEAPDLAALQDAENLLGAAGLTVSAGAATTGDGGAVVSFDLRGGQ